MTDEFNAPPPSAHLAAQSFPFTGTRISESDYRFLIVASIVLAVVSTEPGIQGHYFAMLHRTSQLVSLFFLVEYVCRLWVAPLKENAGAFSVIKYILSPMAILDLVAIGPAFISSFAPEFYLLRILRLLRVVRLARSKALEESFRRLHFAISSRSNELKISCIYTGIVLFLSSALMYMAEGKIQEEQFGSILRCLWWSVVTITTVGYGETYPVTPMGRLIASAVALIGIAVVAIPFGIISSGFSDAMREEVVELPDRQVQNPGQMTG